MSARSHNWYNLNEQRAYPLDDAATAISDAGVPLPSNILTDANIRFPASAGQLVCLAAVTVTETIATLTFLAADSLDDASPIPLAVVSIPQPVVEGRQYAIQAQYPGAGGWVVFGSGLVDAGFIGRFSTPRQAALLTRCAKSYRSLPVPSLAKLHSATGLTGVVQLSAIEPLQLVKETRRIGNVERDVAVLRLIQPADDTSGISIFEQFAGPCGSRPESGNCGSPEPVEFINAVGPDCNGIITIDLEGCGQIASIFGQCGVVIDCELGLIDVCTRRDNLPGSDGRLPDEYDPACSASSASADPPFVPPPYDPAPWACDFMMLGTGVLPMIATWDSRVTPGFEVRDGYWTFASVDSPHEPSGTILGGAPEFTDPPASDSETFPLFAWSSVSFGAAYQLWVINETSGAKVIDVVTGDPEYQTVTELTPGPYRAYIRGIDGESNPTLWNGPYNFTITGTIPPAPDPDPIVPPVDNAFPNTSYSTNDPQSYGRRNQLVWCGYDSTTLNRRVKTHFMMLGGPPGLRHNAGFLVNYRQHSTVEDRVEFYQAELDYETLTLRILFFNGTSFIPLAEKTVTHIKLNVWYQLQVDVGDELSGGVPITLQLTLVPGQPSTPVNESVGPVLAPNFMPDIGIYGITTNLAATHFSFLSIEALP